MSPCPSWQVLSVACHCHLTDSIILAMATLGDKIISICMCLIPQAVQDKNSAVCCVTVAHDKQY